MLVGLTGLARGLEEKYQEVSEAMNQLFYRGLTQADANLLDGLLDRILANLECCEQELKKSRNRKEHENGKSKMGAEH